MIDFRNLVKLFIGNRAASKTCAACGREFECGANLKGCWCMEIETTEETRAELQNKYKGCLCRECLVQSSKSKVPSSPANLEP